MAHPMCFARASIRSSVTRSCLRPAAETMSFRRSGCSTQNSSMAARTLRPAALSPGTLPTARAGFLIPPTAAVFSISFWAFFVCVLGSCVNVIACRAAGRARGAPSPSAVMRSIALPHQPVLLQLVFADLLLAVPESAGRPSSLPPRPLRRRLLLVVLPSVESSAPPRPPPWVPRLLLGRLRPLVVEVVLAEGGGVPGVNKACPGAGAVHEALLVGGP